MCYLLSKLGYAITARSRGVKMDLTIELYLFLRIFLTEKFTIIIIVIICLNLIPFETKFVKN